MENLSRVRTERNPNQERKLIPTMVGLAFVVGIAVGGLVFGGRTNRVEVITPTTTVPATTAPTFQTLAPPPR